MADETAPKPPKIHRLQIGFNVVVQVVLVLFLVLVVNYLGFRHYQRWDLSRDRKYDLSDKTERFLQSIKGKVRATIFFNPEHPLGGDVQTLLARYQDASRGRIDLEVIDPDRNIGRARELLEKYKVVSGESLVILDYQGSHKTVKASEMAEMDQGNPMLGEPPKMTAFKGEQAITSALIDLVEGKKNIVGYVLGHGEPPPNEQGQMAILKLLVEGENIELRELKLSETNAVPEDISAILINGPQYDFSERELQLLRDYWNKQGRIMLLYDSAADTPRLSAFLNELGVRINDDRLMAMVQTGIQEVLRTRDVYASFQPGTPVTSRLEGVQAIFPGGTSSMILEMDRARQNNIELQPLVQAAKGYWGEVDYRSTDENVLQYDQGKDHGEPLTLAALIEKGGSGDERVQVNSSRMVLVTNSTFILDQAITQSQQALDFVSAGLNWLLNREQLIGIAPKIPKTLTFALEERTLSSIRWLVLVLLPLIPAILGAAVWWQRRA